MYDLKVNCVFMPHKGVGNFGVKCSACTAGELQCDGSGRHTK